MSKHLICLVVLLLTSVVLSIPSRQEPQQKHKHNKLRESKRLRRRAAVKYDNVPASIPKREKEQVPSSSSKIVSSGSVKSSLDMNRSTQRSKNQTRRRRQQQRLLDESVNEEGILDFIFGEGPSKGKSSGGGPSKGGLSSSVLSEGKGKGSKGKGKGTGDGGGRSDTICGDQIDENSSTDNGKGKGSKGGKGKRSSSLQGRRLSEGKGSSGKGKGTTYVDDSTSEEDEGCVEEDDDGTQGDDATVEPEPCSLTPEARSALIFDIISTISPMTELLDITTARGKAIDWLINGDEYYICPDNPKIIQRYVMGLLYFGMDGDNWTQCSALLNSQCNFAPSYSGNRFLTPIHECYWAGDQCNENLCVTRIHIKANNLNGELFDELCHLQELIEIKVDGNKKINGTIPSCYGELPDLEILDLDDNRIVGEIPTEIYGLTNLVALDLNSNMLSGVIPETIGNLNKLRTLQLDRNLFQGPVPASIANMTQLDSLTLYGNQFTGAIHDDICDLRGGQLKVLWRDCDLPCNCCDGCR